VAATSLDPASPIAAANVKIPKAQASDNAICTCAVSAGVVDTEALDHFPNKDEMLATADRTPAGRLVEPDDIAAAVSFLCSDDAAMVCGHTLVVDGGFRLPA